MALRNDLQRFMQTILIGATIGGVISTAMITEICGQLCGPQGLAIASVSVIFLQLVIGEIIPKSVAVANPYWVADKMLPIYYGVSRCVYPFSRGLNKAVSAFLGIFGVRVDTSKTPYVTEEELDLIFQSAMKRGIVEKEEGEMIRSVRTLDTKSVNEVMTPLVGMICIDAKEPIHALHDLCLMTQFSRIPVFADRFDNIVGVVSMKALLKNISESTGQKGPAFNNLTVEEIAEKAIFILKTMTLLNALRLLKEKTLAICVDEYGGTTGLVTLEDVLEEIVGEIYDPDEEKDKKERTEKYLQIRDNGDGSYTILATADIEDVSTPRCGNARRGLQLHWWLHV